MPKSGSANSYVPSVLDRLLDDHPQLDEVPGSYLFDSRELLDGLLRDLSDLLNTHRATELGMKFPLVRQSLPAYGLPSLSVADRVRMCGELEAAIRSFEPRLSRVQVTDYGGSPQRGRLHLRIEGVLMVDRGRDEVYFDAELPLHRQRFKLKAQDPTEAD